MEESKYEAFEKELKELINKHSVENNSGTPDFILAEYIMGCLKAFEHSMNRREIWHGNKPWK